MWGAGHVHMVCLSLRTINGLPHLAARYIQFISHLIHCWICLLVCQLIMRAFDICFFHQKLQRRGYH